MIAWSHIGAACVALAIAVAGAVVPAIAAADNSRILATGGATQFEGQAGGGIVPWAVLAGYGSTGEVGVSAFGTYLPTDDYALKVAGFAVSFENRVELSYARQSLDLGTLGTALGLDDPDFRQDVFGLKVRLFGDLIYEAWPQISAGLQYKRHLDFAIPAAVGAADDADADFYVAATKLWLAGLFDRNVFANVTLRYTRANQAGLVGFGGDVEDDRTVVFEGSAGIFVNRYVAIGGEYRQHPDNLSFTEQNDWFDVFVGWFPNKHVSVVAAYANLGTVATLNQQDGVYVSIELAY